MLFQSYYSLISNVQFFMNIVQLSTDFNPIIVLFLTPTGFCDVLIIIFQSYYSLISNHTHQSGSHIFQFQSYYSLISNLQNQIHQTPQEQNFNPIIVLFLTKKHYLKQRQCLQNFNPIIVLFLTQSKSKIKSLSKLFQSYYSLISNLFLSLE